MENFHEKHNNVCKCSDLISVPFPISLASPSIAFCPVLYQVGRQAWKFNGLEGYMDETVSVGFLEALT